MIMQFPVAHDDELLVSVLARFVSRQGMRDDKSALDVLFGSRNIVPSPLLQGHIKELLSRVGHIWPINANELIDRHSILPFFQSFIEPARINEMKQGLIENNKSNIMTTIGINASSILWPQFYRYCPDCVMDDQNYLAYSYWRRLFQLPGVHVCPVHHCYLQDSNFKLSAYRRHSFWDASYILEPIATLSVNGDHKLLMLSNIMCKLLRTNTPYVSPPQWTVFYQRCVNDAGLKIGKRTNYTDIKMLVQRHWGKELLKKHGLSLDSNAHWTTALFRKHRRHYNALYHIFCVSAMKPNTPFLDVLEEASSIHIKSPKIKTYVNSCASKRSSEYRLCWQKICSKSASLKEIRATSEGARVYSWLYRFDTKWLQNNMPKPISNNVGRKVNWGKRDIEIVRKLIQVRNSSYDDLFLPRMTKTWFIAKTNVSWGINSHLEKLPLCKSFFVKYCESIEEYQIRRVLGIILDYFTRNRPIPKPYEIERIAGLSKERKREPVKQVLKMDFNQFSFHKLYSKQYRAKTG